MATSAPLAAITQGVTWCSSLTPRASSTRRTGANQTFVARALGLLRGHWRQAQGAWTGAGSLPASLSRRHFACRVLRPRVRCCTSQLGALLRRRVPLPELHKAMFERVDPVRFQEFGLSRLLPACRQCCNSDHLIDLHHLGVSVYLFQPVHASAPSTPPPNRIYDKTDAAAARRCRSPAKRAATCCWAQSSWRTASCSRSTGATGESI